MHCPADRVSLQRVRIGTGGFVWACPQCHGRAIAMPVLRRHFAAEAARAVWQETFGQEASRVACPSCQRKTNAVSVAFDGGPPVALDVCRSCALVWFDPDEHDRLPPAPPPPPAPDDGLTVEMRQRLAILEVQEMARRAREEHAATPSLHPSRLPALLGLPVEVGDHELLRRPWATWITAGVVAGVSGAGFAWPEVVDSLQMVPEDVIGPGLPTLLTSFFVHAGWWHLLSNLWFLVAFGDNVEDLLGHRRWLLLLLTATFLGGLAHALFDPRASIPCVGASGGISGLVLFYALSMPQARLGVFLFVGMFARWVTFSAKTGLVLWLAVQVYTVVGQVMESGNVSGLAHVGGALVGFLFWLQWRERPRA